MLWRDSDDVTCLVWGRKANHGKRDVGDGYSKNTVALKLKVNFRNTHSTCGVCWALPGDDWSLDATRVAGVGLRRLIWKAEEWL